MTQRRKKLVYYVLIPLLLLYCLLMGWHWYSSQLGLLSNAAFMGNLSDVRKYVGRFPWAVDHKLYGLSLLQDAVEQGHRSVAEFLVAKGATVDMHSAAGLGMVDEVERLLKSDPTLVEKRIGVKHRTPLHFAAIMGEEATTRLLVERGASTDARGGWGSPLYDAVDHGWQWYFRRGPLRRAAVIEKGATAADILVEFWAFAQVCQESRKDAEVGAV